MRRDCALSGLSSFSRSTRGENDGIRLYFLGIGDFDEDVRNLHPTGDFDENLQNLLLDYGFPRTVPLFPVCLMENREVLVVSDSWWKSCFDSISEKRL